MKDGARASHAEMSARQQILKLIQCDFQTQAMRFAFSTIWLFAKFAEKT